MESSPVILAIDLGKFHSVFCWYDTASKKTEFRKVSTFPDSFREILPGKPCARVVLEACSQAGWVLSAAGDPMDPEMCQVADPGKEIPQRPESPSSQAVSVFSFLLKSGGHESGSASEPTPSTTFPNYSLTPRLCSSSMISR
jgi:hypothetical protein